MKIKLAYVDPAKNSTKGSLYEMKENAGMWERWMIEVANRQGKKVYIYPASKRDIKKISKIEEEDFLKFGGSNERSVL
tara:strand:+ start:2949 stop:3182 length:234 start_codon:yes stop_codon:yes gene_type:complete